MKRLLLLIAVSIVWSGSVLQAQEYEYVPLVREGIEWGYKNGEIYRFIGEEIINGKVYKQLGNSSRDYPDSYKIAGYAREENKVVYRLYSKDAEEVPIYDFNVKQVGDIMQAWHTEPGYFGMKVESLDSIVSRESEVPKPDITFCIRSIKSLRSLTKRPRINSNT